MCAHQQLNYNVSCFSLLKDPGQSFLKKNKHLGEFPVNILFIAMLLLVKCALNCGVNYFKFL